MTVSLNYPKLSSTLIFLTGFEMACVFLSSDFDTRYSGLFEAAALGTLVQLEVPGGIPNLYRHVQAYTETMATDAVLSGIQKIWLFAWPFLQIRVERRTG